jgi:hypothetical protein
MKNKIKIFSAIVLLLMLFSFSGCGASSVSVGIGVYAPGAWGPYGGGYYHPPVGIGYPGY